MSVSSIAELAPAKVNLSLHVTGRRADGYHLLDSLVAFADFGDAVTVSLAPRSQLVVHGPEERGVPIDQTNSILRAAALAGVTVSVDLTKELPSAAGIGGGSSDAAAVLRAISRLTGAPLLAQAERLGADVPVCLYGRAVRMQGIGENLTPAALPALPAVLVNPRREVSTPLAFKGLRRADNPPMPDLPDMPTVETCLRFLSLQRNDLEPMARAIEPEIDRVLLAIAQHPETRLARMSGSGATCFGLFETREAAERAATALRAEHSGWWVRATVLR